MFRVKYEDEKKTGNFCSNFTSHIYHLQNLFKPVEASYFIRLRFTNC